MMEQSAPHNSWVISNFHFRERLKLAKSNWSVSAVYASYTDCHYQFRKRSKVTLFVTKHDRPLSTLTKTTHKVSTLALFLFPRSIHFIVYFSHKIAITTSISSKKKRKKNMGKRTQFPPKLACILVDPKFHLLFFFLSAGSIRFLFFFSIIAKTLTKRRTRFSPKLTWQAPLISMGLFICTTTSRETSARQSEKVPFTTAIT